MRPVSAEEAVFLVLLFAGVGALVVGMLWTRLNWRPDIPPDGRRTRSLDVMLHPGRYATSDAVRSIRVFTVTGAIFVTGAVVVLASELLRITFGG
jgi:hypothetical protein